METNETPARMSDHWWWRPGVRPGRRTYVWHILFDDQPAVRELARHCQERVGAISCLRPVPVEWLHMTALVAGFADEIEDARVQDMIEAVRERARPLSPVDVSVGRLLRSHTEALVLGVNPEHGLDAVHTLLRDAAAATVDAEPPADWTPHLAVAYSDSDAPAAPVFAAMRPPPEPARVRVGAVHLVSQERVGRAYVWERVATVELGG